MTSSGLIFIGPSSKAINQIGDKRAAKEFLFQYSKNVPLIPGYYGRNQEVNLLTKEADKIGYPVLLKASTGGGGRGMRVVDKSSDMPHEIERAMSEAQRSFGASHLLIERYVTRGKHIEIQIVGDLHGRVIALYERDCSVQRRNQKVIEEAPCNWLDSELRSKMMTAAVEIGKLLHYHGAGTVEFIVDVKKREFYFLEVNTRIQVEHPITEETTGVDLVALQLYVASAGRLDLIPQLQSIKPTGHAIECRLCAEDAFSNFSPATGKILKWSTALETISNRLEGVRYESGVETGIFD